MTIEVKNAWEAWKIVETLEYVGRIHHSEKPWAHDMATRIKSQVEEHKRRVAAQQGTLGI